MLDEQIAVDDDKASTPENIPGPHTGKGVCYKEWGHTWIDYQQQGDGKMENPSMSMPEEVILSMSCGK